VRAELIVAADGRFSRVRHLLGWEPVGTAPPMDVLWLRLPRRAMDPEVTGAGVVGRGRLLVLLNRGNEWQGGYVFPKDGYRQVRAAGLEAFRASLVELLPWLADRVGDIQDWNQMAVLAVASNRLPKWYCAGLLLIGDAAHTMSPVAGVGINYAIQDAVESANVLIPKLKAGYVAVEDLAEVQRRREWPTRIIQKIQGFIQRHVVLQALTADRPFRLPLLLRLIPRLPLLRRLPARILGFGPKRVRLDPSLANGTR
jgi:2-polyprenyl-6-methoxyphenol hydroxylase-like FAD-dependent oxidoreductase